MRFKMMQSQRLAAKTYLDENLAGDADGIVLLVQIRVVLHAVTREELVAVFEATVGGERRVRRGQREALLGRVHGEVVTIFRQTSQCFCQVCGMVSESFSSGR